MKHWICCYVCVVKMDVHLGNTWSSGMVKEEEGTQPTCETALSFHQSAAFTLPLTHTDIHSTCTHPRGEDVKERLNCFVEPICWKNNRSQGPSQNHIKTADFCSSATESFHLLICDVNLRELQHERKVTKRRGVKKTQNKFNKAQQTIFFFLNLTRN